MTFVLQALALACVYFGSFFGILGSGALLMWYVGQCLTALDKGRFKTALALILGGLFAGCILAAGIAISVVGDEAMPPFLRVKSEVAAND